MAPGLARHGIAVLAERLCELAAGEIAREAHSVRQLCVRRQ
jgi:hypothetical protein